MKPVVPGLPHPPLGTKSGCGVAKGDAEALQKSVRSKLLIKCITTERRAKSTAP